MGPAARLSAGPVLGSGPAYVPQKMVSLPALMRVLTFIRSSIRLTKLERIAGAKRQFGLARS